MDKNLTERVKRISSLVAQLFVSFADRELMTPDAPVIKPQCEKLDRKQIETRLRSCPCLPSLGSIDSALKELLGADQRYTSQIAEIIRRDPSLTSRLLRLVNSVYYGLSTPIKNIEEAVFFLGVRQIRQLAMVTPIIEDFQKLVGNHRFPWREFWQHCIGTALMAREIIDLVQSPTEEIDYVAGLIHDVGKIVIAASFPEHFNEIYHRHKDGDVELLQLEENVLGINHAELGALYLTRQNMPAVFVDIVRHHHQPERAQENVSIISAVQLADLLVRHAKIGNSGNWNEVDEEAPFRSTGWQILFGQLSTEEKAITQASLKRSLERIPTILEGLV
jgi:putative nucleotidyltransferase with HDIG domain